MARQELINNNPQPIVKQFTFTVDKDSVEFLVPIGKVRYSYPDNGN